MRNFLGSVCVYNRIHYLLLDLVLDRSGQFALHIVGDFLAELLLAALLDTVLFEQFVVQRRSRAGWKFS